MTRFIIGLRVCCIASFAWTYAAKACPFDPEDPLLNLRAWADQAIVRINTLGPGECTNTGTGFFINAAGDIITAGHVVPVNCADGNTTIEVRWSKGPKSNELSEPVTARVAGRSSLDVALLELDDPPDDARQFLRTHSQAGDAGEYKDSCVLLPSHYFEATDTTSTFAEITSVALIGDPRWVLSGEGFNASRSGSPVILPNGQVAAIFVARPGDASDRTKIVQSRAYVLPIGIVPAKEIDITAIADKIGKLKPFLTLPSEEAATKRAGAIVNTSFGLSITEPGFRLDPNLPTYLYQDGHLSAAESLERAMLQALLTQSDILRQVTVRKSFNASPGYAFDPSTLTMEVASLNPPGASLPTQQCETSTDTGCYSINENGRILELRINLYPGVDGRRSWLDGEVRIAQRPQ